MGKGLASRKIMLETGLYAGSLPESLVPKPRAFSGFLQRGEGSGGLV